ncbi:MAG: ATP-binding protein [Halomonas sp.]|nr:AAA family ATPase [Halomonas sp.]MDN6298215.1 ATP-binding protein [Halomonas sp.]
MNQTPSIKKLKIKNFGCIGSQIIELDIDNIVALVGPNNAGKSTILKAYEAVTDCLKLEQEDFHNKQVSVDSFPEIEVHSIATEENKPGDEWCLHQGSGTYLVREKWKWTGTNKEPVRVGFNVNLDNWAQEGDREKMPWGINNVAKARRPKPHRVNTFDDPEIQSKAITSLLKSLLEDSIKKIKENNEEEKTKYEILVESLKELRDSSKITQQESIEDLEVTANEIISKIFPSHELKISSPESSAPIKIDLLGNEFSIEMGTIGGLTFPLEKQGSGSRRTALWTILKLLADNGVRAKAGGKTAKSHHEPVGPNTSHVLLLDEPEVSLHPSATEIARDVLYSLPDNKNWQIMVATHSPSFIDLTKDHTTIIGSSTFHVDLA